MTKQISTLQTTMLCLSTSFFQPLMPSKYVFWKNGVGFEIYIKFKVSDEHFLSCTVAKKITTYITIRLAQTKVAIRINVFIHWNL